MVAATAKIPHLHCDDTNIIQLLNWFIIHLLQGLMLQIAIKGTHDGEMRRHVDSVGRGGNAAVADAGSSERERCATERRVAVLTA